MGTGSKKWAATPVSMNTWSCSLSLHTENYLRIMDPELSYKLVTSDLSEKFCLFRKGREEFQCAVIGTSQAFFEPPGKLQALCCIFSVNI